MGWTTEESGLDSWQGHETSLFSVASRRSRQSLRLSQPPIKRISGIVSPPGGGGAELYFHSPIRFRSMMINYVSTAIIHLYVTIQTPETIVLA
jgi:hypothetical protein